MSRHNDNLELVLTGWIDARRRRDLETIERHLHPDVVWQGHRPDVVCGDRAAVLDNVRSGDGWPPDVSGIELHADGDQVMLGVHSPDLVEIAGERIDGEIYDVFTIIDGLIVGMDEYRTRDDALEAMQPHLAQTAAGAEALQRTPTAPVEDLIPFVHVADVARSIAFYELLGFAVRATHGPSDRLEWAALEHQHAKLMVARADSPIDSNTGRAVLSLHPRPPGAADASARSRAARRRDPGWHPRAASRDASARPGRLRAHRRPARQRLNRRTSSRRGVRSASCMADGR